MDIWFDSGISWSYALDAPQVADLYLEGYDQFTGWFQSSLITSVAARSVSPFKSIFVHGFTVDEKGLKMSKSMGNVTHPKDIIENYNVDTLRWWIASHLIGQTPLSVKPHLFDESANAILKIRKVLRYLIGYVEKLERSDSQPKAKFNIDYDRLSPLDTYILNALAKFDANAEKLASTYRFPIYINNINKYIGDDLSAVYIDNIKDRLYSNPPQETIQTINVLFAQFCIVNKILWPIVPHLVEEVWNYYSKSSSFFNQQFIVPIEWHNTKFDASMQLAKQLIVKFRENITKTTWYYDVRITCGAEEMKKLQLLHPNDGQIHNDSQLCEILQAQSVQLIESPNSGLTLEKCDIEQKLCDRCRRYAITPAETICQRCAVILQKMNFNPK